MIVQNPAALFFLLCLVPVIIISLLRFSALNHCRLLSARIIAPFILRISSFVCLVLAFANISWGTRPVFSRRGGQAVSFVFDISYSMTCDDALGQNSTAGKLSRLDASRALALGIVGRLKQDTPISVVIAKGDGTVAIPSTNDRAQIASFLSALSPNMMSSPGSSIGKGIAAACLTFPVNFAYKPVIVVFTDGDETDDLMSDAVTNAVRAGISVYFAGFGSENETEITAGDGITRVKTALRKDALISVVENAQNFAAKYYQFSASGYFPDQTAANEYSVPDARFFLTAEQGSASRLLDALNKNAEQTMTAEMQNVPRRAVFLFFAILFFCAGLLCEQLHIKKITRLVKLFFPAAIIVLSLTSCSSSFMAAIEIFTGTLQWRQQNYAKAEKSFSLAYENAQKNKNETRAEYALYGLAVTYLAQNNESTALEKLNFLAKNASDDIRFAAFYNSGIIASNAGKYNDAANFFKSALTIDSTNISAKINLEIAQSLYDEYARAAREDLIPAANSKENPTAAEQQVFSFIREMDAKQWKTNQDEFKNNSDIIDY